MRKLYADGSIPMDQLENFVETDGWNACTSVDTSYDWHVLRAVAGRGCGQAETFWSEVGHCWILTGTKNDHRIGLDAAVFLLRRVQLCICHDLR